MQDLILHQYDSSPFSEKIRLILGYLELQSCWVEIPPIMPRDDLMPLTGGYRRTPVLQIGRDIYCDSALIAKVLAEQVSQTRLFPDESAATAEVFSQWVDTFLFRVVVALAFQPKALAGNQVMQDPSEAAAFMADRAAFMAGSTALQMELAVAQSHFTSFLEMMERQLVNVRFLFGDAPCIADFSVYHCLWFIGARPILAAEFAQFPQVEHWMALMQAFSHGEHQLIDGSAALTQARSAPDPVDYEVLQQGVQALPIDYGFQPVAGVLVACQGAPRDCYSILRSHEAIGSILVHFPKMGFRIESVSLGGG
jgi:glutathione S-transferase